MRNEKQQKGTGKKKKIYWPLFIAAIFSLPFHATAQSIPTQQLRGLVMDQVLQVPVEGATVTLAKLNRSTTTDEKGAFRFSGVPIGVQQLTVTYVGYKEATLDNINVNSGKETVLAIALENTIRKADVIIVKTNSKRNKPLNDMSPREWQRVSRVFLQPMMGTTISPSVAIRQQACCGAWKALIFQIPITLAAPAAAVAASLF
jgi:hypothetical protein